MTRTPISADWLREQYITRRRSTVDIAQEVGVSPATIAVALRRYSIPRRGRSEAQKAAIASGRHPHPTVARERRRARRDTADRLAAAWGRFLAAGREVLAELGVRL